MLLGVVITFTALIAASCKLVPVDPSTHRTRLGDIQLAIASGSNSLAEVEFRGRVIRVGGDTTVASIGSFKGYIRLRDTLTNNVISVLYTLPNNIQVRADTTMRVVCIFKQARGRLALILKTKNDSLVCMMGTMLKTELDSLLRKSGAQGFRVAVGSDVYASRYTECGREGDYNMTFSTNDGSVVIPPARSGSLQNGDKAYAAYNVVNTQLIKNLDTCPNFTPEFAYMIIKQ